MTNLPRILLAQDFHANSPMIRAIFTSAVIDGKLKAAQLKVAGIETDFSLT